MRAGRLRHVVKLQQYTKVPDGGGGGEMTWTDLSVMRANIQPLRGRERFEAQQTQHEITHRVTVRFRNDVKAKMRIVHDTDVYEIESVLPDPTMKKRLSLMCIENPVKYAN